MPLRIATFNVNNLFRRAKVMELPGFSAKAKAILEDITRLNELLEETSYLGTVGDKIKQLLEKYDFHKNLKDEDRWFKIVEVKNKLFSKKQDGSGVTLKAKGRKSWIGWVELIRDIVDEACIDNVGRVLQAVKADVLCMVEVEDRATLARFNLEVLEKFKPQYARNLLVDGNDERGIDLGLFSQFPIRSVRSHIDDTYEADNGQTELVFSRDCPEYEVQLTGGRSLWVLCNHFKSKGYGSPTSNNKKRKRQADQVRDILKRFDLTLDFVVVAGDLNDTPKSAPLKNLLEMPNLFDVLAWPNFPGPRWTYKNGKDSIDYLLVSKPLHDQLLDVGIERRGMYSKTDFGGQFSHFPEVTGTTTVASDHACVWADFAL